MCGENNLSEQTFHRWKREFGMIDVNQAKRMKELFEGERAVKTDAGRRPSGKNYKPWAQAASGRETCGSGPVFDACSVPIPSPASLPPMRIRRRIQMPGE